MKKKNTINDIAIEKFIQLYITENKTKEQVKTELNISEGTFRSIKKTHNISKISPKQYKVDILKQCSIEDIKQYFESHTRTETSEHFNISEQNLKDLMSEYNFHHTIEQKVSLRRKTCTEMYGVQCVLLRQDVRDAACSKESIAKMLNTQRKNNLEKYGVEYMWEREDVKDKTRQTNIERYGTEKGWASTDDGKRIISQIHSNPEYQKREIESKRRNNSFNKSSKEEEFYDLLLRAFSKEDIYRQYCSDAYPFNCDFYIKPIDLYIECNFHWTHGKMPFDANNSICINKLSIWKEKAKTSKFYECAVDVWTNRDCKKLACARENKINAVFVYPNEYNNVILKGGNIINTNTITTGLGANGVMDGLREEFLDLPLDPPKHE